MYFPTAVALAALPFLVGAVPVKNSLISIPLSKRSTSHDADGVVDVADLQAGISYTGAFVLPVLFMEKGVLLTEAFT
jgi:hypothetical protein